MILVPLLPLALATGWVMGHGISQVIRFVRVRTGDHPGISCSDAVHVIEALAMDEPVALVEHRAGVYWARSVAYRQVKLPEAARK